MVVVVVVAVVVQDVAVVQVPKDRFDWRHFRIVTGGSLWWLV